MGITHFDEARSRSYDVGHIKGEWTGLGEAAGSVTVGVRRIRVPQGFWTTPAHEHGREEEIFHILDGTGVSWQNGKAAPIRTGDTIVYLPGKGAHTVHATTDLDLLAFGPRISDESPRFPRLGLSFVGNRAVETISTRLNGLPIQFVKEAELGPPELPDETSERPPTIKHIDEIDTESVDRPKVKVTGRNLGVAVGSVHTGLQYMSVAPGYESGAMHCHSVEEEIFVVLEGEGVLLLRHVNEETEHETPIRAGSVIARPAGSRVAHLFKAAPDTELTYLAYGTRDSNDVAYYPRSNKIYWCGVGIRGRIERLDYWDGED
jgi:uncharacterized cupin superfamily protein